MNSKDRIFLLSLTLVIILAIFLTHQKIQHIPKDVEITPDALYDIFERDLRFMCEKDIYNRTVEAFIMYHHPAVRKKMRSVINQALEQCEYCNSTEIIGGYFNGYSAINATGYEEGDRETNWEELH